MKLGSGSKTRGGLESTANATDLGREFRLYVIGQGVSIVGDRVALITLVFLIIRLSHAYAPALALFYICRAAPTVVGGLLVGAVVDRFDRRQLMIGCDLARGFLLVLVPTLTTFDLGILYPMVVLLFAFTLVFTTAARAALPDVVPEQRMMTANATLQGMNDFADIAYALGGTLVFVFGYRIPFYLDALTFAFSAFMIYLMRIPTRRENTSLDARNLVTRIRAGFGFISGHPFLRWSIIAFAVAPIAGGGIYVLAPLYAGATLAHSAGLFGPLRNGAFRFSVLEVALGMGALLGSVTAPRLASRWPRGRLFGTGLVGYGIAYATLALITNLYLAALAIAVSGAFFSIFMVSGMTLNQILTPTEMRGRVLAARFTVINGALVLGSAITGPALLLVSIPTLWLTEGLLVAASSLVVWLLPEVRDQR